MRCLNHDRWHGLFRSVSATAMGLALAQPMLTGPAQADIQLAPDANTLWVEPFDAITYDPARIKGWWHFDALNVEILPQGVARLREVGERSWGNLQRYVPYDMRPGQEHRYLQVRLGASEDSAHFLTLANASTGGKPMGRAFAGVNTIDLSPQGLQGKKASFALTLTHRGPNGTEPGGWLDVDWVQVVKVPYDGLTMTLRKADGASADQAATAELGDTLQLRYFSRQRLAQDDFAVRFHRVADMAPLDLAGQPVRLTYQGVEGQAHVYGVDLPLTDQAASITADKPGDVLATAIIGSDETHTPSAFAFDVKTTRVAPQRPAVTAATPRARENRTLWSQRTAGRNLAAGLPVAYSSKPDYRLTVDDRDTLDLTDGQLAARGDDKIWFARNAVGWTQGDLGVNLLLDLKQPQAIERVVLRVLGGGEQRSLLFPGELVLVASDDGKTFHRVASLNKLMPGEKEQADQPGVFYLPEEGHAYTYPIMFDNLRLKARYIGLRVVGSSSYVFADELAVIAGEFDDSQAASLDTFSRMDFAMQGLVIAPFHGEIAIATNVPTPHRFVHTDMRPADDQKKPTTYIFELPSAINLDHVTLQRQGKVEQEAIERDGQPYTRWKVTHPSRTFGYNMGGFFFSVKRGVTAEALKDAKAYLYAQAEGYTPNEVAVPIALVEIPAVPKLEKLHVSLAWMSESAAMEWPDFHDAWQHLGFNTVSTFPRYWAKGEPSQATADWLKASRQRGFKVLYNESPFHVMVNANRNNPEIYSQLPAGPSKHACPSYRGEHYQAEVDRVGKLAAAVKPDYVFHDIELWYHGSIEATSCSRCLQRMKESGLELAAFQAMLGNEMIADMNTAIQKHLQGSGHPMPTVGIYNIHAQRPVYDFVFDFNRLYDQHIQLAQPSLYVRGSAAIVREVIRGNHDKLANRNTIPWLSAGTYGEFNPELLEPMILETLLNGARGITYYWFGDFDNARDWLHHARALATLAPYEDLLTQGRQLAVTQDNDVLSVTAWGDDSQALVLVGNYQHAGQSRITLTLPMSRINQVRDLTAGQALRPVGATLTLDVPPGQYRLLHVTGPSADRSAEVQSSHPSSALSLRH